MIRELPRLKPQLCLYPVCPDSFLLLQKCTLRCRYYSHILVLLAEFSQYLQRYGRCSTRPRSRSPRGRPNITSTSATLCFVRHVSWKISSSSYYQLKSDKSGSTTEASPSFIFFSSNCQRARYIFSLGLSNNY